MPEEISLVDFLPEFFDAFAARIKQDQDRWGNVWLQRPIVQDRQYHNQDSRVFGRFDEYWEEFEEDGILIDRETWLKIIGNAFIAWVRLQHPELFPNGFTDPQYREDGE